VRLGLSKGRPDLLDAAGREFHERHVWTQSLVRWTMGSTTVQRGLARILAEVSRGALALRGDGPTVRLCSAAFAMSYWRGVATELGGSANVASLIERGRPASNASTPV